MRQVIGAVCILASLACTSGRAPVTVVPEVATPDAGAADAGDAARSDPGDAGASALADGGGRCSGLDTSGVEVVNHSDGRDPCAGILPPAPQGPRTFQDRAHLAGDVCGIAVGSGDGHVVWTVNYNGPYILNRLLDADANLLPWSLTSQNVGDRYIPQPHGFLDFANLDHGGELKAVIAITDTRGEGANQNVYNAIEFPTLAYSRNGGLAVAGGIDSTPIVTYPVPRRLWVFNEDASTRFGPTRLAGDSAIVAVGIDASGATLVLNHDDSGKLAGEWFDRDGTALTGAFQTAICTPQPEGWSQQFDLAPLVGSGLALRRTRADFRTFPSAWHSEWIAIFPSGAPTIAPVPAWLAARPDTSLVALPLRHAYAFTAQGDASRTCSPSVEFVAPDGSSCGVQEYPLDDAGTCGVSELRIGVDGTVLEPLPESMEQSLGGSDRTCTLRFWPGALR